MYNYKRKRTEIVGNDLSFFFSFFLSFFLSMIFLTSVKSDLFIHLTKTKINSWFWFHSVGFLVSTFFFLRWIFWLACNLHRHFLFFSWSERSGLHGRSGSISARLPPSLISFWVLEIFLFQNFGSTSHFDSARFSFFFVSLRCYCPSTTPLFPLQ